MISIKILLISSLLIHTVLSLRCNYSRCAAVTCPELKCAENEIKQRDGLCGCCDLCKKIIGENETCAETTFVAGQTSNTVVCAEGLYCDYEFGRVCKKWKGD